jgi:isoleucyl-tRNA synthetase
VADVGRKLSMVWNMYDFFTMYAEVDNWEWDGRFGDPSEQLTNPLDQWVVSRAHQLTQEVAKHMDAYDVPNAAKLILPFIEDASNWYVRRSRRRFWKTEDDADKKMAYRTLHYVLVQLAHVMAPFTPFLAEELFHKLTGEESVHLRDWPAAGHVNELVLDRMHFVREVINEGLSQRAAAGVKVRQPLQAVAVTGLDQLGEEVDALTSILLEELNVKELKAATGSKLKVKLDTTITPVLKREGMVRELIRNVQNARKQAGLNVDDRIKLSLSTTDEELRQAIDEHKDLVLAETLARELVYDQTLGFETSCAVDDAPLTVSLEKV